MALTIAVYDSGVGGLPYLKWLMDHLPGVNYFYLADNAEFPYGEKNPADLVAIAQERVGRIIRHCNPDLIVLACNTASVIALASLRETYDLPFVGVVPAVKPAAEKSKSGRIGLLATNRTVADRYTEDLITQFAAGCVVTRVGDARMVEFIERNYADAKKADIHAVLSDSVKVMQDAEIDALVVGCTHFTYIVDELREALGDGVEIVDSRQGVGKQVMRVAGTIGTGNEHGGSAAFRCTSDTGEERLKRFCDLFGLRYEGVLSE